MSDYLNLLDASTFFVVGSIVALTTLTLSIIGSNHLLSNKDDPMRNDYKHPLVFIAAVLFIFVTCSIVAFLGGYLYLGIYEAFKTGEISIPIWILTRGPRCMYCRISPLSNGLTLIHFFRKILEKYTKTWGKPRKPKEHYWKLRKPTEFVFSNFEFLFLLFLNVFLVPWAV